jgi:hypothetical protein
MFYTSLFLFCDILSICHTFLSPWHLVHVFVGVSQIEQKSVNPWNSVQCARTWANPGYGQSDRTEFYQPIDALPNLTLDMVGHTQQKSINPWI